MVPDALTPEFFGRDPVVVARALLGCLLVRREHGEVVAVTRVVETEAYDCPRDPSCYVLERLPGAKEAMTGPPGRFYFHKSYEHRLLNVVCRDVGVDASILVRAVEIVSGEAWMRLHRAARRAVDLTNGPAKLVVALDLGERFAGREVNDPEVFFVRGEVRDEAVEVTARVGLARGAELPWRFLVRGNPWVSRGKPSAP